MAIQPNTWVSDVYGQSFCVYVGLYLFSFNLICNTTTFSIIFTFEPRPQVGGGGCKEEYVLAWCTKLYSLYFDMQHDHSQKTTVFTF